MTTKTKKKTKTKKRRPVAKRRPGRKTQRRQALPLPPASPATGSVEDQANNTTTAGESDAETGAHAVEEQPAGDQTDHPKIEEGA